MGRTRLAQIAPDAAKIIGGMNLALSLMPAKA